MKRTNLFFSDGIDRFDSLFIIFNGNDLQLSIGGQYRGSGGGDGAVAVTASKRRFNRQ